MKFSGEISRKVPDFSERDGRLAVRMYYGSQRSAAQTIVGGCSKTVGTLTAHAGEGHGGLATGDFHVCGGGVLER